MAVTVTRTAPPATPTGVTATAVNGFDKCYNEESGTLTDRTTEFITVGSDVDSFAAQNDYVYFSQEKNKYGASGTTSESRITKLHIVLSTPASASIVPTFEYNTGNNTWATLAVTDGTAGFTQDGTITVTPATMPTNGVWQIGSQDGQGNEIGDGVDRRYLRIKRTADTLVTPPKISESGVGYLTASKTYYYKTSALKSGAIDTNPTAYMRSAPCAEVSATTTAVKRSIKVQWDTDAVTPLRALWRTPTSADYNEASIREVSARYIDTYCQAVGCIVNYNPISSYSGTQNYVVDNGLPVIFAYDATATFLTYYVSYKYYDCSRGDLFVSGGTSGTPANFNDIYNADVAAGWNTFQRTLQPGSLSQTGEQIYTCHDNLKISDYFTDSFFTFIGDSAVLTNSTNAVITFGTRGAYGNLYGGGKIVVVNPMAENHNWKFFGTQFNGTVFVAAGFNSMQTFVVFPIIDTGCKLYGCTFEGIGQLQQPTLQGTNLIVDGLNIYNARYGLQIAAASFATASFNKVIIMGGTGIYGAWTGNTDATFRNFEFRNVNRFCVHYVNSAYPIVNLNMVNFVNIGTSAQDIEDTALIGLYWTIYEKYEFNLKVIDSSGTAISGATVTITDTAGTLLHTLTTNVTGDVTQQDITYKTYTAGTLYSATYRQYKADVITTLTPHTIVISKAGYQTKTIKYTVNRKMTEVETLEKQIPMFNIIGDDAKLVVNSNPTNPGNNILLDVLD